MKKIRAATPAAPAASIPRTFSPPAPLLPCITDASVVVGVGELVGEVTSAVSTTTVTSVVVEGWPFWPVTVRVIFVVNEVVDFEAEEGEVMGGVVVLLAVLTVLAVESVLGVVVEVLVEVAVLVPVLVPEVVVVVVSVVGGVVVKSLGVVVDVCDVVGGVVVGRVEVDKVVLFD